MAPRSPRLNRCKSTIDTSTYYSKQAILTIIDPYLINILLFIIICLPILIGSIISFPFYLIACKVIINSYTFCLKQHILIIKSNYRLKGIRGVIFDSILIYGWQSFMIIFLSIDLLLFPQISKIKIKSPVFITGCPRSGTTFTHRIITTPPFSSSSSSSSSNINLIEKSPFVIHALWEILCPSLTLKYFIYNIINVIDGFIEKCLGSKGDILSGAYDYKLNSEAAEEGLLGMHCMAGDFWSEFLPVGFWFDIITKYIGLNNKNHWKNNHIVLLKSLLQRQIFWSGKQQIVAKSPSLCWFLQDIIDIFPDSKILLLIRDPYHMICSNLSLFNQTWNNLYGDKYMKRLINKTNNDNIWLTAYKSLIWRRSQQSQRYLNILDKGNKNKNILVIRYDDIKNNLSRSFEKCMEFCQFEINQETKQWIKQKEDKQKTRKRTHKIRSIASYGLDPQKIKEQFSAVIKRWNFKTEWQ